MESKNERKNFMELITNGFLHDTSKSLSAAESRLASILRNDKLKFDIDTRKSLLELEKVLNGVRAQFISFHQLAMQKTNSSIESQSKEYCNLNSLAQIAVNMLKMDIKTEKITFDFSYSSNCNIFCNKNEIIDAIIQIVKNSIESFVNVDYQRMIGITTKHFIEGGVKHTKLEIMNNGPIIPKDIQSVIFEPYVTFKNNASGIGLSIAKNLIEKNGGKIGLQSPTSYGNSNLDNVNGVVFKIIFTEQNKI